MRFLATFTLSLAVQAPLGAQTPTGIRIDPTVAIPMRDGVVLRADVWRPDRDGRFPVLVFRTPYDRRDTEASGLTAQAIARGYVVVMQDVRGRYGSDGDFEAYRHEGNDGYDTIEWAAVQPWSSGEVGTVGLSYPAAVQWLAALQHPPHLRAMAPAMTYATPESFWYSGGVWDGSWLDWTWFNIAPDGSRRLGLAMPSMDDTTLARLHAHWPLLTLPDLKSIAPWYYEWMHHPPRDPWWNWAAVDGHYQDLSVAVLNLSGWFDEPYGPMGAATNFAGIVRSGGGGRTRLILGPWIHGVEATKRASTADRTFGSGAALDYSGVVLAWMDRYLKHDTAGADSTPPVLAFMMGANEWRRYSVWPPAELRPDTLYLARTHLRPATGLLAHRMPPSGLAASLFRTDPSHPLTDPFNGTPGPHDYRALAGQADALVFETPPLEDAVEIAGPVVADLVASATVPDFDLWMQLYDVAPDGTAWNLAGAGNGLVRASYREGGPERRLIPAGQPVHLLFDRTITANRFLPGHRVRIVISASFAPYFSLNPQTGDQEFDTRATRRGTISIHHSRREPSRVILPLLPAQSTQ